MNELRPVQLPRPNEACWCGSGEKYKKCHRGADSVAVRTERTGAGGSRLKPGLISPRREVPASIPRPDYARTGRPARGGSADDEKVKLTGDPLVRMRRACRAAADILREAGTHVRPGLTTDALDALVHELTLQKGGYPSPLNYHGFPKSLCTSVNEVICHGIPDNRALEEGDIVNLDVTIYLDGMHGDTNATFPVGKIDDESARLVRVTYECLMRGIEAVKPGRPISDIGRAIETLATEHKLGVVRAYCGHGIGERFHTALQIPHYYEKEADTVMEPGMTFTIEPMLSLGDWQHRTWNDGWTAVTADGSRSAQFEHTVLVTDTGVEILTLPTGN
jgi:methionyl aminopeptidase